MASTKHPSRVWSRKNAASKGYRPGSRAFFIVEPVVVAVDQNSSNGEAEQEE
jgi:hypothetical protein